MQNLKVTVVGESWHGSNCTSLATGFRDLGHVTDLIGCDEFFPTVGRRLVPRIVRRLGRPLWVSEYNQHIRTQICDFSPDLVVIYKGSWVTLETLRYIKARGIWTCNMFPDISVFAEVGVDPQLFFEFDHVFTAKSFGVADLRRHFGIERATFLPHGFDPLVHRPVPVDSSSDVCFVGTWSDHKERHLSAIATALGAGRLVIWGTQWERARSKVLEPAIRQRPARGDLYAQALSRARVSVALLTQRRSGASSGDLTTARTFEIPACGGFMLHERNDEVRSFFEEGREIECFDGVDELVDKTRYYLEHEAERADIAEAGRLRCLRDHSYSRRARVIVDEFVASRSGAT